jgi:HD-GYP domain-containing protein (c-di-GMP phosphodiesterase class II)
MLKKIATAQLRLGMHVHALEGSWLDHPFWKSKFMLDSPADLRRLRESGVAQCWINVALGRDLDLSPDVRPACAAPAVAAAAAAPSALAPCEAAAPAATRKPAASSMADELGQAANICSQGRAQVAAMFNEARMGRAVNAEACQPLVESITLSVVRNPGAMVSLARLKTKDDYSYMHSVAVCALMVALAREMGMDDAACRAAGMAGLLHDLGKALVPLALLNKPGKLDEAEFAVLRLHPERGHALLLEGQGAPSEALDVCLHHHERMDGKGYPFGLEGQALSVLARMGAVCDVYDAITSTRPYKACWDPADSIARMSGWTGHFDAAIFASFVRTLGIYPTGSLVKLASGRLAVVVEQNPAKLAAPIVKCFYSTKSMMPTPPVLLDLARHDSERIVSRESPARWGFAKLDELWLAPEVLKRSR